jgi:uncharacterized protein YkwD
VVALILALQFFGLMAALQAPLSTAPLAAGDTIVALTFTTSRADERTADAGMILTDINAARRADGIAPLALDQKLCSLALSHARDMLLRRYVSHTTPDGVSPFDRMRSVGYEFSYAGENIALNADRASAEQALMASEPHRRNILDPHYARVGIAAVATDGRELMVVQEFTN